MKLIKNYPLTLNRVGQVLASSCLLSLSLTSRVLGRNFYAINYSALFVCLPITVIIISFQLIYRHYDDLFYMNASRPTHRGVLDQVTKDHIITEKYIFLFVYFLSDFICAFQLSTILINMIGLNQSLFYTHMPLFFSISWSTFVHFICRKPDFEIKYHTILRLVGHLPTDFSKFSPKFISMILTYALLYCSAAVTYTHPLLSQVTLLCAMALIVLDLKWFIQTNYTLYLMLFSSRSFNNFSTLLYQSMHHLQLSYHLPVIPVCANLISPCIAILYCSAYIISTSRKDLIKNVQPNS